MRKLTTEVRDIPLKSIHWDWWESLDEYWKKIFIVILVNKNKKKWKIKFLEIFGKKIKESDSLNISSNDLSEIINFKKLHICFDARCTICKNNFHSSKLNNNIKPLSILSNLEYLSIGSITNNLAPLKNLEKIKELELNYTQISNLEPLKNLTALESLRFNNNQITSLEPLRNLTKLKYLNFGWNRVESLEPLRNLTNLETLEFPENKVKNLEPLKFLTKMSWLSFENRKEYLNYYKSDRIDDLMKDKNRIEDLNPLRNLKNIEHLDFRQNKVKSLEPLKNLKKLESLWFDWNKVKSLEPLNSLDNISSIFCKSNYINEEEIIAFKKLKKID